MLRLSHYSINKSIAYSKQNVDFSGFFSKIDLYIQKRDQVSKLDVYEIIELNHLI